MESLPSTLTLTLTLTDTLPEPRTKFRYIIHGIPRNKKYTIEEARWCDQTGQFISEKIHAVQATTLKHWLGYIPSSLGDITTTMWLGIPLTVFNGSSKVSPLELWDNNHEVFAPHSLERLRFFRQGTCHEQASRIPL